MRIPHTWWQSTMHFNSLSRNSNCQVHFANDVLRTELSAPKLALSCACHRPGRQDLRFYLHTEKTLSNSGSKSFTRDCISAMYDDLLFRTARVQRHRRSLHLLLTPLISRNRVCSFFEPANLHDPHERLLISPIPPRRRASGNELCSFHCLKSWNAYP
jgi:hypothetical protein